MPSGLTYHPRRVGPEHRVAHLHGPKDDIVAGVVGGVRVLAFYQELSRPFATIGRTDVGADALKVEARERGGDSRNLGPALQVDQAAELFSVNRNKRAIAIDLRDSASREAARYSSAVLSR